MCTVQYREPAANALILSTIGLTFRLKFKLKKLPRKQNTATSAWTTLLSANLDANHPWHRQQGERGDPCSLQHRGRQQHSHRGIPAVRATLKRMQGEEEKTKRMKGEGNFRSPVASILALVAGTAPRLRHPHL